MNFKTKQSVKANKISAQEAYDKLYPLVGERYSRIIPTMKWLKNIVEGRKIIQRPSKDLNKKLNFKNKKINK